MSFGLAMQGLEKAMTDLVDGVRRHFTPCTYLEIGVASGATLAEVAVRLQGGGHGWRAVGCDLPEGYSLDRDEIARNCAAKQMNLAFIKPEGWNAISPTWNRVSVILCDVRDFFEGIWTEPIHIALIDGCHCKECVMRDFMNVEKYMPVGGVVMFHDFDKAIDDPQPHGGHCDVVGACQTLGLVEGQREGWGTPIFLDADKFNGGANMLAIRRTK